MRKLSFTTFEKSTLLSFEDVAVLRSIVGHLREFQIELAAREAYWWLVNERWRFSPVRWMKRRLDKEFDTLYNTDTEVRVELPELSVVGANREHGVYYQASPVWATRCVLADLPIDYSRFAFVDFGSGKGRALLLASEFAFKHVIGVEFSCELHEIAQANISRYGKKNCKSVTSINCDATNFEFPCEDLVLYFYNPFDDEILGKVLNNLRLSMQENTREAYFVYHYLGSPELLSNRDEFELICKWHKFTILRWRNF